MATTTTINLVDNPMSLDDFISMAEHDIRSLQLPKPPLWHVAQDGIAADSPDRLWLEFGTGSATTTRMLCEARGRGEVYTFDWFQGLPEDWTEEAPKGSFTFPPPVDLPANGHIVHGLFDETLGPFLEEHPEPADLVHIDCDIYSSTHTVLDGLSDRIVPGTVLVFDELLYYRGREDHEVRAFYEWLIKTGKSFEWIGHQDGPTGPDLLPMIEKDPSSALDYLVSIESNMARFDIPLCERVALRIV